MEKCCKSCRFSRVNTEGNEHCNYVLKCDYNHSHWQACTAPTRSSKKPTNPKDAVGIRKWRQFCTVPFTVIWHIGVAMLEGACKYGRHNYRDAGVCTSVYIDAAMGHITQWWEGEDIDPDSGLCHLDKALASLCVLRDGMLAGNYNDDRPIKANIGDIRENLQGVVESILDKYPDRVAPFTELKHGKGVSDNDASS